MDAWWNMITSVYNFLSASTNLAQTLDRKYANHRANIHISPLLIEAPPEKSRQVFPEEFPWFVQLMNNEQDCTGNSTKGTVFSKERTDCCEYLDKLNTQQNNQPQVDKNVSIIAGIEKELHNVLAWEQSIIQNYLDNEERALDDLVQNVNTISTKSYATSGRNSTQQEENHKSPTDDETVKFNEVSDDSCDIQKFNNFEQNIDSSKSQNVHQSGEIDERNDSQECSLSFENRTVTIANLGTKKSTGKQDSCCDEEKTVDKMEAIHKSTVDERNSKVEKKKCSKYHKPSKCKHDELTEESASENSAAVSCKLNGDLNNETEKSELRSIKTAPPDDELSKCSPTVPRKVCKRNYSDIVPKNINELKEHLDSINKSKLYKRPTRSINTRSTENRKLSDDPENKNVNFTVFTANISYKENQKNKLVSKKNSRVSDRFASVESVVKKLITGGGKVNKNAEVVSPSSPTNNRNVTMKKTNSPQINTDSSAKTSSDVDDNKTSKKSLGKLPKPTSSTYPGHISEKTNSSVVNDKSLRNKYTISKSIKPESSSETESTTNKLTPISKMNTPDSGTSKRNTFQKLRQPSRERSSHAKTPTGKQPITKNSPS
nr:uncharacterized protein LOC111508118 [Leptinotarsa decemlineata]